MLSFWAAAENRSTLSVWGQKQVHAKINSKTDPTSPAIGLKRNVPIFPVKTQVHPSCLLCLTFNCFFCRFLANQRSSTISPVLHRPLKTKQKADSADKSTTGSTSTSVLFLLGISLFCCNSSCRVDPGVLHPATHSLVHTLQCGKAAAFFVPSTSMGFAAEG